MFLDKNRPVAQQARHTPAGLNELQTELKSVKAAELLLVSDMTGTLITQTADSMLPSMRQALRFLTERGATVLLATADSGHSVNEFFLQPLGAKDVSNLYVVHSVGAWRGRVAAGDLEVISQGADLAFEDRIELLLAMNRALCSVLGAGSPLFTSPREQAVELVKSAARTSLHRLSTHFGAQSFIEIIPSKAAIFFLEEKIAGPVQQAVFDAYVMDQNVQAIMQSNSYQFIRGGNYVDIFTCTKEEGVRDLLRHVPLEQKRTLIVLGDSENDMGLLLEPYAGFDRITRVFVGQSKGVLENMLRSPFRDEFYYLPGMHCEGSSQVLNSIAG